MAIAAALTALLLAAGCGSDDDSATGSSDGEVTVETGSLSKAKFVEQANAICQKTKDQFNKEAAQFVEQVSKKPPKPTEGSPEEKLVEKAVVPNYQNEVDEISALGAPSGDEKEVTAFLEALQQVVDGASEEPASFVQSGGSFGKAPKLAKAYGLSGCAEL